MKLCLCCNYSFFDKKWRCPRCCSSPKEQGGFLAFAPDLNSDTGFKDVYFDKLVELEERNFWFRARNELVLWALDNYFPGVDNFLEIGCGTGYVLAGIAASHPELKMSGSEISSVGLAYTAKRVPDAELFQMDGRLIPFVEEFDVIGAFDVLEHIKEDSEVIHQMFKAVRPGGGILLTVPQHAFLWSPTDEHACHIRRYSSRELTLKIENAGFRIERLTSFVSLLLPPMIISRKHQLLFEKDHDILSELRIGKFANFWMGKIMITEKLAIRAGFNFPFGGSLMIVARKKR